MGQEFIEDWKTKENKEFQKKLTQAIIDRIDDKSQFIAANDVNSMIKCIKETKMAVENELEDMRIMKDEL